MTKRILRLTASPHAIAAGVAAGVFASFTPFLGFHFMIAFLISYIVAGNFVAAALGTFFGNPFTFPIIWASTFAVGRFILSGAAATPFFHENAPHARLGEITGTGIFEFGISGMLAKLVSLWEPVVKPMMVGAIPLGIVAAIVAYLLTWWVSTGVRAARKKRLAAKAKLQQNGQPNAVANEGSDALPQAADRSR